MNRFNEEEKKVNFDDYQHIKTISEKDFLFDREEEEKRLIKCVKKISNHTNENLLDICSFKNA